MMGLNLQLFTIFGSRIIYQEESQLRAELLWAKNIAHAIRSVTWTFQRSNFALVS